MPENALVVDNDFFFVKFLASMLEERGCEVFQAFDAKQGIDALEARMVDYVFVNILMPRINGRQFIKFIKEKHKDIGFSIIAMSDSIIELRELQQGIGADYYLQKKPVEKMAEYVEKFMSFIEGDPFLSTTNQELLDQEKVFRRQATVDLLESLRFQEAILESAGIGLIAMERDARIVAINSLALDILKRPFSRTLSRKITAVFPASEKNKIVDGLKKVVRNPHFNHRFPVVLHSREIVLTVSLLQVTSDVEGWVLLIEDPNPSNGSSLT